MFIFFMIFGIVSVLVLLFVIIKLYLYEGNMEKFLKEPKNWIVSFNQDEIGRVIELNDGIATIKTANGEFKKEVTQIILLYKIER